MTYTKLYDGNYEYVFFAYLNLHTFVLISVIRKKSKSFY